eukprot:TRINITY_DN8400_c0_g1_i5.p1 TRINITY_DN8400_c0_g1~~TRINITY_DN8400_c0_g1_i5.p1  ORF type:complete len:791 (+),score=208.43 TRINITY_DN8400_c0_g1_i5:45-2417(+)
MSFRSAKNRNLRKRADLIDESDLNAGTTETPSAEISSTENPSTTTTIAKTVAKTTGEVSSIVSVNKSIQRENVDEEQNDSDDGLDRLILRAPRPSAKSNASLHRPSTNTTNTTNTLNTNQSQSFSKGISASTNAMQKTPLQQKPLLSFMGDDDDEDGIHSLLKKSDTKVKKPISNKNNAAERKMKRNDLPMLDRSSASSYASSSVGEYTPEKMAELQKKTFRNRISAPLPIPSKDAQEDGDKISELDGAIDLDGEEGDDAPTFVPPDVAAIRAIKEMRDRRRREGENPAPSEEPEEDFISLKAKTEKEETSRLVREEDDDAEDESFEDHKGNRIRFGDPGKDKKDKKLVVLDDDESDMDVSEDEEVKEWEREQIAKSTRNAQGESQPAPGTSYPRTVYNASTIVFHSCADYHLDSLWAKVVTTHQRLVEDQKYLSIDLEQSSRDTEQAKAELASLQEDEIRIVEQYRFYQEMKMYLDDLVDCLSAKVPMIEELEEESTKERCKSAQEYFERRKQNRDEDQQWYLEDAGAVPISKGDVDELGRDRSYAKSIIKKKRTESRRLFQERLAEKRARGEEANDWSDDDDADLISKIDGVDVTIESASKQIFGDAADEFRNLSIIKEKMERWKNTFPTSYKEAFVSLSIPTLFAPFVRLENMSWYPFSQPDFTKSAWYSQLFDYGMSENPDADDEDSKLIPTLMDKIVLVGALDLFKSTWDPESVNQTKAALDFLNEILIYVEPSAQSFVDTLDVILQRLTEMVEHSTIPICHGAQVDLEQDLTTRRFWHCVKVHR